MATLYIDLENGNDNYGGTSFAVLQQGTDGRITSATFSSAGASFPNDGSLIGQYLSIFNGTIYAVYNITAWVSATSLTIAAISGGTALANQTSDRQYYIGGRWKSITTGATAVRTIPGDTIRVMGSPAPTSLGQTAAWTSGALQASKTVSSSTNTTPITITCTAHGYSTGDSVVVDGHLTNTNANGTWEITVTGANTFMLDGSAGNGVGGGSGTVRLRNNTRVMLTTAVTQNIASTGPGRAAWTSAGGANVVTSLSTTTFKEHYQSDSLAIQAGFTTGLAAYWVLPSTLNLSGYQQVSFWIRQSTGTIGAAGSIDLRLCSDAAGVTAVNTISIPNLAALNRWMPVTVDLGTNLGSSIQSIALYVNTDNGAQTILLNNIIACKASSAADSLTLTSLIGKNVTGETFWGIQSINGNRVMLDNHTNIGPNDSTLRGYYGTSETVTTWKREAIKLGPAASGVSLQTIQEGGTDGSSITYSGGWNRTDMSTKSLEAWLDGVNGNGIALVISGMSFISMENFSAVRFANAFGLRSAASNNSLSFGSINNCTSGAAETSVSSFSATVSAGFICANGAGYALTGNTSTCKLNITYGALSNASNVFNISNGSILEITGTASGTPVANNGGGALFGSQAGPGPFKNLTFADNTGASIASDLGAVPFRYLINCLLNDATEVSQSANYNPTQIASHNHDGTAGNHKIFMDGGLISSAIDQRKTASGISWKLQPTSATLRTSVRPVTLSLAKIAVSANSLVTVKAWMYRDNSGLTMRLVCKGGQLAGVANDVVSTLTATNAWEEEIISFTPTETGVVEITAEAWGGTTFSGWVDDLSITQA